MRGRADLEPAAAALVAHLGPDGRMPVHAYQKWQGPLWTLVCLAETGHRRGDQSLLPLRDQFREWLFAERHLRPPHSLLIPGQEDRFRRCACQEGFQAWSEMRLGIADETTEELIRRLKRWQWPDGGWNCDKRREAHVSSFIETLPPLRALALHAQLTGSASSRTAARRAAEVFLSRRLFRRRSDGSVINPRFLLLSFPHFWPYDILFGLLVMAEAGFIGDPRCAEALDLLETKRLRDGGWPLEQKVWKAAETFMSRGTFYDWGPAGTRRSNPWVTAQARSVLEAAGRM
jgi:hypothetical protein